MSNQLIPFNFEAKEIRVLTDESNQPWFVAKDVCELLGYADHKKALSMLDTDEGSRIPLIDSLGREQETLTINESGLYTLIIRSNKPKAKEFRKWVTSVVLPSIRKTGSYSINQESPIIDVLPEPEPVTALVPIKQPKKQEINPTKIAKDIKAWKVITKEIIQGINENQLILSAIHAIKVQHDVNLVEMLNIPDQFIAENQTSHHYTSGKLGEILAEKLNLPNKIQANKINQLLEVQGFAYPIKNSKGNIERWEATEKGKAHSVMLDTTKRHSNGQPISNIHWFLSILDCLEIPEEITKPSSKNLKPSQPQETFLS